MLLVSLESLGCEEFHFALHCPKDNCWAVPKNKSMYHANNDAMYQAISCKNL